MSEALTQKRPRARLHAENFSEVLDVEINPREDSHVRKYHGDEKNKMEPCLEREEQRGRVSISDPAHREETVARWVGHYPWASVKWQHQCHTG